MIFSEHPIYILWAYLLIINVVLYFVMGTDKALAKRHARRVPEATLFLLALIGGSAGGLLGMIAYRHKTKHPSFFIGFPLIFLVQLALIIWLGMKIA